MPINQDVTVGFDLGIASIGWSILKLDKKNNNNKVIDAGIWTFNAPETDKEKIPKNQIRREARLLRRNITRRRQRMNAIRNLLYQYNLFPTSKKNIQQELQYKINNTPWELRIKALDCLLTQEELGICLYHIAKHRGFKSNRKGGEKAEAGDNQKALKAMAGLGKIVEQYRSFAEALIKDNIFKGRQRNMPSDYGRTPKRIWLEQEVETIFQNQRNFGSKFALKEFEKEYTKTAFYQRPLQDSILLLGNCSFETKEKRAAKYAPSFELFRFLTKLNNIRILNRNTHQKRALSTEEINKIYNIFSQQQLVTYKRIRKELDLPVALFSFDGITRNTAKKKGKEEDQEAYDIVAHKEKSAQGTALFRNILGKNYHYISVENMDKLAEIISFHENMENIEKKISQLNLEPEIQTLIIKAVEKNQFSFFNGAGHISSKACRRLIPYLKQGKSYSEACEIMGYDHTAPDGSPLMILQQKVKNLSPTRIRKTISEFLNSKDQHLLGSPVARKAVIEGIKQFVALVYNHPALNGDLPGKINVELARSLGLGPQERGKLDKIIKEGTQRNVRQVKEFEELYPHEKINASNLRLYSLAKEQEWRCLYTGDAIKADHLFDGISYQIDHILPWSRFGDDSFHNLTLCTASANQTKKNRTPFEWMTEDANAPDFGEYQYRIDNVSYISQKKRRKYLLLNAQEVEENYRERNLNDTRWACKVFLHLLSLFYQEEDEFKKRRIFARPGQLTARMRQVWGIEHLKKDQNGKRIADDRHHALDAIVVASISESLLQSYTKENIKAVEQGLKRTYKRFPYLYEGYRDDILQIFNQINVARAEEVKVPGQIHKETIVSVDLAENITYARVTPEKLLELVTKDKQLESLGVAKILEKYFKNSERSQFIINELTRWYQAGQPKDTPPTGPTGDHIGKIKIIDLSGKIEVPIRHGSAGRGDMVRVDIFSKANKKGKKQYYIVPIYPHHLTQANPPNRAIVAHKSEAEWTVMDSTYIFEFSLYRRSLMQIITKDGEIFCGYYMSVNRSSGVIDIVPIFSLAKEYIKTLGAKNLLEIKKMKIDRLGNIYPVTTEPRLWHVQADISKERE